MTHHYPDLGSTSDWLKQIFQPIRSTTQIWSVMHHQYGISVLVAQMSFRRETSGGVEKCRPFSQARKITNFVIVLPNSVCNHANHARALWRVLSNYLGMMRTVLFNCPIKAEIWAVDSQSDLRILL